MKPCKQKFMTRRCGRKRTLTPLPTAQKKQSPKALPQTTDLVRRCYDMGLFASTQDAQKAIMAEARFTTFNRIALELSWAQNKPILVTNYRPYTGEATQDREARDTRMETAQAKVKHWEAVIGIKTLKLIADLALWQRPLEPAAWPELRANLDCATRMLNKCSRNNDRTAPNLHWNRVKGFAQTSKSARKSENRP